MTIHCIFRATRVAVVVILVAGSIIGSCVAEGATLIDDHFAHFDSSLWKPHNGPYLTGAPEYSQITVSDQRDVLFMSSTLGDQGTWENRGYGTTAAYSFPAATLTADINVLSGDAGQPFMFHINPSPWMEGPLVSLYLTPDGKVHGAVWTKSGGKIYQHSGGSMWSYDNWYTVGISVDAVHSEFYLNDASGNRLWTSSIDHGLASVGDEFYVEFFSNLTSSATTTDTVMVDRITLTSVPEPSSTLTLMSGIVVTAAVRRRMAH